jgi:hypothetical protein
LDVEELCQRWWYISGDNETFQGLMGLPGKKELLQDGRTFLEEVGHFRRYLAFLKIVGFCRKSWAYQDALESYWR